MPHTGLNSGVVGQSHVVPAVVGGLLDVGLSNMNTSSLSFCPKGKNGLKFGKPGTGFCLVGRLAKALNAKLSLEGLKPLGLRAACEFPLNGRLSKAPFSNTNGVASSDVLIG